MRTGGSPRQSARRRLLLAVVVTCAGVAHANIDTSTRAERGEIGVPEPGRAKLSSLGFEPVVADYYWVQALQLVGGTGGDVSEHGDTIGDLIDLVTALDPWVDHPYRFAAVWMTGDLAQVRRANSILERGISYHPDDWRNRFHLGYNRFYYLQDNASAADVLESAIPMEGAPDYLGAFVARLRADGGDLANAARFLETLIENAPDEYVKAEYLKAFDEIVTERRARYLDAARTEFWKRHGRDIRRTSELWEGPTRIIPRPPPAHPHFEGFEWQLDPISNEIVSSFYEGRYRLHINGADVALRERWRRQLEAEEQGGGS